MMFIALLVALFLSILSVVHSMRLSMSSTSKVRDVMETRKLGTSDLMVSEICLGTMTWGVQNSMEEGAEQMDYYFNECGGNFMDTAEMYPVPTSADTQVRH